MVKILLCAARRQFLPLFFSKLQIAHRCYRFLLSGASTKCVAERTCALLPEIKIVYITANSHATLQRHRAQRRTWTRVKYRPRAVTFLSGDELIWQNMHAAGGSHCGDPHLAETRKGCFTLKWKWWRVPAPVSVCVCV